MLDFQGKNGFKMIFGWIVRDSEEEKLCLGEKGGPGLGFGVQYCGVFGWVLVLLVFCWDFGFGSLLAIFWRDSQEEKLGIGRWLFFVGFSGKKWV